jgi:hypothetical protein
MANEIVKFSASDYEVLDPSTISNLSDVVAMNLEASDMTPRRFFPQIKMPLLGNTSWVVPSTEGDVDTKSFSGIILHIQKERGLFDKDYTPGARPYCSSDNGLVGIGEPGGSCETCPNSQFGPNNERPACAEKRAVYILMKEEIIPMVLRITPSSFKTLDNYCLTASRKLKSYKAFETKFSLKAVKAGVGTTVSEVVFEIDSVLDREAVNSVEQVRQSLLPYIAPGVPVVDKRHDELAAA